MQQKIDEHGLKYFEPKDPNDLALLQMAEGSIFSNTTFPSGWTSPETTHVCKDGRLYEADNADQRNLDDVQPDTGEGTRPSSFLRGDMLIGFAIAIGLYWILM